MRAGDFIYVSGQGPINPQTDQMETGDIRDQTRRVLSNIELILEGAGASMADVVRCNVYLIEASDFAAMNEVYREFFGQHKPTRTTVVTGLVAPGMKVEIDCVAYRPRS